MTRSTSQFAQPRIDVRAFLGLYDPADSTDWGPIRAAQLHAGRDFTLFALVDGIVKYEWKSNTKKQVSVYPA